MVEVCIEYLKQKIRAVMGENAPIFTRLAAARACVESHMASIVVDGDVSEYNGRECRNVSTRQNDRKLLDRTITINVILGEVSVAALEPLYTAFLASLDRGIMNEGHFIEIRLGEAGWADEKDSLLKAKIAVELPVIFVGGVYQPIEYTSIKDFSIERADQNGSQSRNAAGAANGPGN